MTVNRAVSANVALARHEVTAPMLAGQTLRVADWYVRLRRGEPETVVNETYSQVRVDAQGQIAPLAAPADAGWPTPAERQRMNAELFEAPGPVA